MTLNNLALFKVLNVIRSMAKSAKYQLLYSQYKPAGTGIYKNKTDYTKIQLDFLRYLIFYSNINTDIYMDEVPEWVLEDEVYEDAYSYYRSKERKKIQKERIEANKKHMNPNKSKDKNMPRTVSNTHVVFSKPKLRSLSKTKKSSRR